MKKSETDKLYTGEFKRAAVHSFESMAALDGEGIRFDVFFSGCPLRCVYCHNPDTWATEGTVYTTQEVYKKARRYKPYFKDNGGVTFSGGEPLLHAAYINELGEMLKSDGIGYCLDTSGSVPLGDEERRAIDGADMVILDLKFYNEDDYKKYTKGELERVIMTADYCNERNKRLWLRTVIVPGINDSEDDIKKYAALAGRFKFEKYELLGFHTMGFFKYERLGIKNPLAKVQAMDADKLKYLQKIADEEIERLKEKMCNE